MADYKDLASKLVLDAILNKIPGLNVKFDLTYVLSEGEYDPETDTTEPELNVIKDITGVKVKPEFRDTENHGVKWNQTKLLVPGLLIPAEPNVDTDYVTMGNKRYGIHKTLGTPGDPLWIIFLKVT